MTRGEHIEQLEHDLMVSETEAARNWQLYWDAREALRGVLEYLALHTSVSQQGDLWERARNAINATEDLSCERCPECGLSLQAFSGEPGRAPTLRGPND